MKAYCRHNFIHTKFEVLPAPLYWCGFFAPKMLVANMLTEVRIPRQRQQWLFQLTIYSQFYECKRAVVLLRPKWVKKLGFLPISRNASRVYNPLKFSNFSAVYLFVKSAVYSPIFGAVNCGQKPIILRMSKHAKTLRTTTKNPMSHKHRRGLKIDSVKRG